jgi:hypothetical protein
VLRLVLELPLAVLETCILHLVRTAGEENRTLFQNAVDEPAFFQLKYLLGKGLVFVLCDWHSDFSIGGNIMSGLRRRRFFFHCDLGIGTEFIGIFKQFLDTVRV